MRYTIRPAARADGAQMLGLLPRLADFDVPPGRDSRHLWRDDEQLLRRWLAGDAPQCLVQVAEDEVGGIAGLTLVSLRPEPLGHEPSAHLEVIVLRADAQGAGLGRALLEAAEDAARGRGARSMTLHVLARNERARRLYERAGYDGELIRYIKRFAAGHPTPPA